MGWRKVDDSLDVHRKVVRMAAELGPRRFASAMALWTLAGCEASRDPESVVHWSYVDRAPVERPSRAGLDLVNAGLWVRSNDGYRFHDDEDYNPSPAEKAERKRKNADRQRRFRERHNGKSNALRNAGVTRPRTRTRPDPVLSVPNGTPATAEPAAATSPDVPELDSIISLEARYPAGWAGELRDACALSRKTGKMSDSRWLVILQKLAKHPRDAVLAGGGEFIDRYADGEKNEAYMLAIVRNRATSPRRGPAQAAPAEDWGEGDDPSEAARP